MPKTTKLADDSGGKNRPVDTIRKDMKKAIGEIRKWQKTYADLVAELHATEGK